MKIYMLIAEEQDGTKYFWHFTKKRNALRIRHREIMDGAKSWRLVKFDTNKQNAQGVMEAQEDTSGTREEKE